MFLGEILVRIAVWLVAITLAGFWVYGLAALLLPRLGAALSCFIVTPGGIVLILLTWRALRRK